MTELKNSPIEAQLFFLAAKAANTRYPPHSFTRVTPALSDLEDFMQADQPCPYAYHAAFQIFCYSKFGDLTPPQLPSHLFVPSIKCGGIFFTEGRVGHTKVVFIVVNRGDFVCW